MRSQEAEFIKREKKLKEEFNAKNSQLKHIDTTLKKEKGKIERTEVLTAEKSNDPSFNVFWIGNLLVIKIILFYSLGLVALGPLYVIAYWIISFSIIQYELRIRWMVLNVVVFWIIIPGLLTMLFVSTVK